MSCPCDWCDLNGRRDCPKTDLEKDLKEATEEVERLEQIAEEATREVK